MWREIDTPVQAAPCAPPYSFYFDVIGELWTGPNEAHPLHRICSLARKMGVQSLVIESALNRSEVRAEIDDLDKVYEPTGGATGTKQEFGEAQAIAISYFSERVELDTVAEANPDSLIGQAIIINYRAPASAGFSRSYIYEAILQPPRLADRNLLNNYISVSKTFPLTVHGTSFQITGVLYAQQNVKTSACAHTCLRMAVNSTPFANKEITAESINNFLNIQPPVSGLLPQNTISVIDDCGLDALVVDCDKTTPDVYLAELQAWLDSG